MGTLVLVRHGQASFGQADYDQLSELGRHQCVQLGRYLAERRRQFGAVLRGTLRRHEQSLAALGEGYGKLPEASVWPGLDEYDSHALIGSAAGARPPASAHDRESYRRHFQLLREALGLWVAGSRQPPGMPSWQEWTDGVRQALKHVQRCGAGEVLLVSSGGPIATAVAQVLGAPGEAMIDLNMQLRNSALTEMVFSAKRISLLSFNHLPHLDGPKGAEHVTYT
jgi:broad specificity phosphatase PhoE